MLILYTPQAASGIDGVVSNAVSATNTARSQSSAVGSVSAPVVQEWNITEQANTQALLNAFSSDPGVAALRDATETDLAGLVVNSTDECGMASVFAANATNGFFVVRKDCAAANLSLGHEIGHLVGGRHEVEQDPTTTPYACGHGFWNQDVNAGTIMSIMSGERLTYWSGPDVNVEEYPEEEFGSEQADMSTLWTQRSATMASFRSYSGPVFTVDIRAPDEMKWKEECSSGVGLVHGSAHRSNEPEPWSTRILSDYCLMQVP